MVVLVVSEMDNRCRFHRAHHCTTTRCRVAGAAIISALMVVCMGTEVVVVTPMVMEVVVATGEIGIVVRAGRRGMAGRGLEMEVVVEAEVEAEIEVEWVVMRITVAVEEEKEEELRIRGRDGRIKF